MTYFKEQASTLKEDQEGRCTKWKVLLVPLDTNAAYTIRSARTGAVVYAIILRGTTTTSDLNIHKNRCCTSKRNVQNSLRAAKMTWHQGRITTRAMLCILLQGVVNEAPLVMRHHY